MKHTFLAIFVIAFSISISGNLFANDDLSEGTGANSATQSNIEKQQAEAERKYLGAPDGTFCKRKDNVSCLTNGACCSGGEACKKALKSLKLRNSRTSKPAPVDFCS